MTKVVIRGILYTDKEAFCAILRKGKAMLTEDWLDRVAAGSVPHALLLCGAQGAGLIELARSAAARFLFDRDDPAALTDCPFYMELTSYTVDALRDLTAWLNACSYAPGRHCLLLPNADRMNPQMQNALLKTLEEPPPASLILLTGSEQLLLPTVRSRCMILRFGAEPPETVAARLTAKGFAPSAALEAALLADGVYEKAERYCSAEETTFRTEAFKRLDETLFDLTPFTETAALLTVKGQEADEEGGKRRARVSAERLGELIALWQFVLRDALLKRCNSAAFVALSAEKLREKLARRFTTAEIQGMIGLLLDAERKLAFRARPEQLLDGLLAGLVSAAHEQNEKGRD